MVIPSIGSEQGRKAFSFHGPRHWNNVEIELRNLTELNPFKNRLLKEFLRDVNHPG